MIHFVVGTRAQLLKFAPVMVECQTRGLPWRWINTGQHKETFQSVLEFFELPAPSIFAVNWQCEADTIATMGQWIRRATCTLPRSRDILANHTGKGSLVLTHGDTFTTVLGALYGRLTGTEVMHVESGLRSHKLFQPFPEEINRLITFRMATIYACPDETARRNIAGYRGHKFLTGGNTQIDILRYGLKNLDRATISVPDRPYAVLCAHRFENLFSASRLNAIVSLAERATRSMPVCMPLHPVTRKRLQGSGLMEKLSSISNLRILPRLEYPDFLKLVHGAEYVMTDGGGNQEELYHLGVPTLILRDQTERREGLGTTAVLSGLNVSVSDDFLEHYTRHRQLPVIGDHSPTKIIVDEAEARIQTIE